MRKIKIVLIALTIVCYGYGFSQSQQTEQTMKTKNNQEERIALEKRIADAGGDYVSLTAAEYELLLSQPVGDIEGFDPLVKIMGGIMVGYGYPDGPKVYKTDIQIVFPNIPNISAGEVYVIFDHVKGSNGLDYLDRESNTEIKVDGSYPESDFTQLNLYIKSAGSKSYLLGSRYVNLRDPADNMTVRVLGALGGEVGLGVVSGKVVMELPTNITGLTLAKEDIGIEKPFAGGLITLKDIKDDNISFQFKGDRGKIYSWNAYDNANAILEIKNLDITDDIYALYAIHPNSMRIYKSEVVRKEYPFAFGKESQVVTKEVSPGLPEKVSPASPIVYLDKNDPIAIAIKERALSDIKQSVSKSDPESPENKLIAAKVAAWPQEKQDQLMKVYEKSIHDYPAQAHLDVKIFNAGTFLMVYTDFGKMNPKMMAEEYDIRVQSLCGNNYAAEFWEDSEAHARANANNPNVEDIEIIKDLIRLSSGQQSVSDEDGTKTTKMVTLKYTKMMALLYTSDKEGSVTFHDPFQAMMDFIKQ
ncbi:MAG: hypothetical protein NTW31_13365 [Bacteroidetes bacterium]|nr:hypothetical protein [Bacteroidota bacterium]